MHRRRFIQGILAAATVATLGPLSARRTVEATQLPTWGKIDSFRLVESYHANHTLLVDAENVVHLICDLQELSHAQGLPFSVRDTLRDLRRGKAILTVGQYNE